MHLPGELRQMDKHIIAHWGVTAVLGGGLLWSVFADHARHRAVSSDLVSALRAVPKQSVAVLCAPGCGDLAKNIAARFVEAGWQAKVEAGGISDPATLHVFSKSADACAIADLLAKASGVRTLFFDQEPDDEQIEILVGPAEEAK